MKLEKALEELNHSNNPSAKILYQLYLDMERIKVDVKWLKRITLGILVPLLILVLDVFI